MKLTILFLFISTFVFSGFFKDESKITKKEITENKRLCKIFTDKAEKYQVNMRDDILAKVTLESYKHRASIFCSKINK